MIKKKQFDLIYVGTGPILILDAINESLKGNKVLMIDSADKIGGAWKLLNLFDLNDLENAVHYLVPNREGYLFIEEYLGVKLLKIPNKYYAHRFISKPILLDTSIWFGKFLNYFFNEFIDRKFSIIRLLKNLFRKDSTSASRYPRNGFKEIFDKLILLLKNSKVETLLNNEIKSIEIYDKNLININTISKNFKAKKLIISHGFKPPNKIFINKKEIKIEEKIYPRPSLHIVYTVNDFFKIESLKNFTQVIFPPKSCIKYAHNLTKYVERDSDTKKTFSIVVALAHNLKNEKNTYKKVIYLLEEYNLIPNKRFLDNINFYWQDIILPLLSTEDLVYLQDQSKGLIQGMITEELNSCIGYHQSKWLFLKKYIKKNNFEF